LRARQTGEAAVLYLVKPHGAVEWTDMPSSAMRLAAEHGGDLARLDWQPSERRDHGLLLALALRYGAKCSTGLVLEAGHVADQDHAAQIATAHRDTSAAHAALAPHDAVMEQLLPGTERGRELGESIDRSVQQAYEEARDKAARALSDRDPDPDLQEHWTSLGGWLPTTSNR
jgi:hypothetical protein